MDKPVPCAGRDGLAVFGGSGYQYKPPTCSPSSSCIRFNPVKRASFSSWIRSIVKKQLYYQGTALLGFFLLYRKVYYQGAAFIMDQVYRQGTGLLPRYCILSRNRSIINEQVYRQGKDLLSRNISIVRSISILLGKV